MEKKRKYLEQYITFGLTSILNNGVEKQIALCATLFTVPNQ